MAKNLLRSATTMIALLAGMAAAPAMAQGTPQARLVHCGQDTCLRISGQRPAGAAIRLDGHELLVAGGRKWRATVPLATARSWGTAAGDAMTLTYLDTRDTVQGRQELTLPPGALGRRVTLASLEVRAR